MCKRLFSITVLALLLMAVTNGAQQTAQQQPTPAPKDDQKQPPSGQPTFKAGINFVRVDVIVSDKRGDPVADLKQADFEVLEDGRPQTVEQFKLIKIGGAEEIGADPPREIRTQYDEESEAARDDVRLFAIFLDDYHVRRGASMGVREPLIKFIQTQLGPSDMVGLMYPLTPLDVVRLGRNREAVAKALERFDGRKYDYTPRNQFEEKYAMYPAAVVERIRNEVSMTALRGLVTHLGSLRQGRKAVILVSEGFTNMLPPQLRDPIASLPGVGNPARYNPTAGEGDPREQTAGFFATADLQTQLREVYDTANKNNTAIYALDPRGLAPFEFDINENVGFRTDQAMLQSTMDTLRVLADQTDGRAIVNRNDLDGGLRQVVRDSSAYYLLGYNSTQAPADGKFHEIKVRLKRRDPRNLQVRARKGYWALTAEETAHATAPPKPGPPPAVEAALSSIVEPSKGIKVIRTWIGTARGENGKTRVTFVWVPIPPVHGVKRDDAARVSLMASGADGQAYFRGRVPDVALASSGAASAAAASDGTTAAPARGPSKVTFDAAPGRLQLKMTVENTKAQVLDSDVREVTIPDLTKPQVSLSTPEVLRARNVREYRQLAADPDAVPVPEREFSRTDRLLIRVQAYGPGSSIPTVTARLLNRTGKPMGDLAVTTAAPGSITQVDLPLAGLAAGEYLIEIVAKGDGGDAKDVIAFRVTS